MSLALSFGILAGTAQLWGYWIYNREIFKGQIKPNAVSWGLWAGGSVIAFWSYALLTDDWVKNILPVACSVAVIFTFFYSLIKGRFEKPDKTSCIIAILDILVVIFWFVTKSEIYTNIFMQIDVFITFLPLFIEVWRNPEYEKPIPWFIWSMAYACMFISICLSYEKPWDLMYPIMYFILHLTVGLIVSFKKPLQNHVA